MIVANLSEYSAGKRRLRLGLVGGGTGLIGTIHANGARLSNRWWILGSDAGACGSASESGSGICR